MVCIRFFKNNLFLHAVLFYFPHCFVVYSMNTLEMQSCSSGLCQTGTLATLPYALVKKLIIKNRQVLRFGVKGAVIMCIFKTQTKRFNHILNIITDALNADFDITIYYNCLDKQNFFQNPKFSLGAGEYFANAHIV